MERDERRRTVLLRYPVPLLIITLVLAPPTLVFGEYLSTATELSGRRIFLVGILIGAVEFTLVNAFQEYFEVSSGEKHD